MLDSLPSKKNAERLVELDSLRGIACISVMLFHYTHYYNIFWKHSQEPFVVFVYGRYGVDLFFLLSGFVIFMSLKNKSVKDFAILRFWRLFPAYWIALVLIFAVSRTIVLLPEIPVHGRISLLEFLVNFTMIPTIFSLRYVDSTHWTLGFELLFYLQIAAIFVISKSRESLIVSALLFLTSVAVFWRTLALPFFNIKVSRTIYWNDDMLHWQYVFAKLLVLPYIHLFLIGVCLYLFYQKQKLGLFVFGIIFGVISDYFIWGLEHFLVIIFLLLLFGVAIFARLSLLRNRFLVYLGTISYSLYLIHQNIGFRVIQILEGLGVNSNIAILAAILSVMVIANFLYFFIEKPLYELAKQRLAACKDGSTIAY